MGKKFRKAFVVHNSGHNFEPLRKICDEIVFLTHGWEDENTISVAIVSGMLGFDPEQDVLVPVGNVFANVAAGMAATEVCRGHGSIFVAMYKERDYHVRKIDIWKYGDFINEAL